MTYDDTYNGLRYTYGLSYRPLAQSQVPDGWIIWSDKKHNDFKFGTADYPFELTSEQIKSFELTPVRNDIASIICDGCGKEFATTLDEDDDPMPLYEEAEEFGWAVNEDSAHCQNCQHLDPDQLGARIDLDEVEDWPYLESTRGG